MKNKGNRMLRMGVVLLALFGLVPFDYAQDLRFAPRGAEASAPKRTQAHPGLENRVRHELVMMPYYSVFDNLEYKVEGYRVTLSGQVTRPTLRTEAEARVKKIEGVEEVVNNIEVLPVSFNDDRIRRAAFRAIYGDTSLNRYALQRVPPIHIIVKRGQLTLEGVVANESEKNLAEMRAKSVSGAFSITNNLRVEKD